MNKQIETFMSQDIQRWKNRRYACTIYHCEYEGKMTYIVECIHVDRPKERTYIRLENLQGMRGEILKFYVDSELKLSAKDEQVDENKDTSVGYDETWVDSIEFSCQPNQFKKKTQKNGSIYSNWKFEDDTKKLDDKYAPKFIKLNLDKVETSKVEKEAAEK